MLSGALKALALCLDFVGDGAWAPRPWRSGALLSRLPSAFGSFQVDVHGKALVYLPDLVGNLVRELVLLKCLVNEAIIHRLFLGKGCNSRRQIWQINRLDAKFNQDIHDLIGTFRFEGSDNDVFDVARTLQSLIVNDAFEFLIQSLNCISVGGEGKSIL